ncbi:hypothetical protein [Parabacteroides sp. PF5-6]|uniref:hypothetical protein n=1 Tax=Parabacteroides sp. PF5-6 TaxID=1742403 RepID=UPI0024072120|nr:hypothetical protein [Parabacteroides sp. PF5-6]MDF9828776.1 hypothetical protein [Parabacteroides sp. PF5-6]
MANVNDHATTALFTCLEELISLRQDSDDTYFHWMAAGAVYRKENLAYLQVHLAELQAWRKLKSGSMGKHEAFVDADNFIRTINGLPGNSSKLLWDIYKVVLDKATFPNQRKITAEEEETLKKLHAELAVLQPLSDDYSLVYDTVYGDYNELRMKAMYDEEFALKFALNGSIYKKKVDQAMQNWITLGHKGTVERYQNDIQNINRETSENWINTLKKRLQENVLDDTSESASYYSTLGIKDIFDETLNWTEFTIDSTTIENIDTQSKHRFTQNTESTSGMWFWKSRSTQSSHGTSAKSEETEKLAVSKISFKLLQVPIHRPWFDATIIECGAWKWNNPDMDPLSTGGDNPTGDMVAYPTTAIFVKDLSVEVDNLSLLDSVSDSARTTQYNTVGPFRLFRKRENSSRTDATESHEEVSEMEDKKGKMNNPDVQLIGFRCHQLERTPSI